MAKLLEAGTPLGEGVLLLRAMSGQEELGRLSEFQLEFVSRRGDIGAADILGKNLSWSLQLGDGELRYFNGFVTRFAEAGEGSVAGFEDMKHAFFYRAQVHPWLWFLTRASNCRIFQNMTVLQIVDKVFESYPFAHVKKVQLRGDYPTRDYNVQYRETDFNFVCRLFEQEGIYFSFEYDNGRNTLVLMDSYGAHKSLPALEAPFYPESTGVPPQDYISAWSVNREIQPGKYTIDDFNYRTPRDRMTSDCAQPKDHDLAEFEIYDYPGEYSAAGDGTQYARTRIEELHARYEQYSGSGNLRLAAAGRLLKLQEHPRRQYNADYLITSVSYTGSVGEFASGGASGGFHCGLAAIPASTPFRPARITPKPIIQGPQTAIVVGKSGEEIHTDEEGLGRIKVQFHWDRYSKTDENSSCWVRVAQPIAGSSWGFLALPRIGHEVVVEFLEGDPDHPIVTGSVYNEVLKPPYALPTEKTRTGFKSHSSKEGASSNFNELRFEDKKGEEEIYFHAEKDKGIRIKNDRREWIGNNSHRIVTLDDFEKTEGDHHITIAGNRNEKLDGSLSLDIGQNLDGKVGTKIAYDAGSEIHLKAGSTLVLESGTTLSLKVGGNFITIDASGIAIKGTMVQINTGGAAGTGSGAEPLEATLPEEAGNSQGGDMPPPPTKVPPEAYSPQAQMFQMAAASGTPFCEVCNC
jgi:type VI secretion system secreted protein VgrG